MEMVCATSLEVCLEGHNVTPSFLLPFPSWLEGGHDKTNRSFHFGSWGHSHVFRNKIESSTWWLYCTSPWLPNIYVKTNNNSLAFDTGILGFCHLQPNIILTSQTEIFTDASIFQVWSLSLCLGLCHSCYLSHGRT